MHFTKRQQWRSGVGIPDSDRTIPTTADKAFAIGTEFDTEYWRRMACQTEQFRARGDVPNRERLICTGSRYTLSVGTECYFEDIVCEDIVRTYFHGADLFSRCGVPQFEFLIETSRGNQLTVRAEP